MSTSLIGGIPHELEPGIRKHTGDALTIVANNYPKELKAFQKLLKELKTMHTINTDKKTSAIDTQEFVTLINEALKSILTKYGIQAVGLCVGYEDGTLGIDDNLIQSIAQYPLFDLKLATKLGQLDYAINTFNSFITQGKTVKKICQIQEELLKLKIGGKGK